MWIQFLTTTTLKKHQNSHCNSRNVHFLFFPSSETFRRASKQTRVHPNPLTLWGAASKSATQPSEHELRTFVCRSNIDTCVNNSSVALPFPRAPLAGMLLHIPCWRRLSPGGPFQPASPHRTLSQLLPTCRKTIPNNPIIDAAVGWPIMIKLHLTLCIC